MTAQLALDLDRAPPHERRDLDLIAHELWVTRQRALRRAFEAARRPMPCRCWRPLCERGHCLKCGREVT